MMKLKIHMKKTLNTKAVKNATCPLSCVDPLSSGSPGSMLFSPIDSSITLKFWEMKLCENCAFQYTNLKIWCTGALAIFND